MKLPRQCCRPGCSRSAVATLTFVYAESTAVIGPLAASDEPHSWDLCDEHARRITVPRGWEMLRSERGFSAPLAEDYELTALAEAVREVGGRAPITPAVRGFGRRDIDDLDDVDRFARARDEGASGGDAAGGRHRRGAGFSPHTPASDTRDAGPGQFAKPRPGRRGHLRVLPDPVD